MTACLVLPTPSGVLTPCPGTLFWKLLYPFCLHPHTPLASSFQPKAMVKGHYETRAPMTSVTLLFYEGSSFSTLWFSYGTVLPATRRLPHRINIPSGYKNKETSERSSSGLLKTWQLTAFTDLDPLCLSEIRRLSGRLACIPCSLKS